MAESTLTLSMAATAASTPLFPPLLPSPAGLRFVVMNDLIGTGEALLPVYMSVFDPS